MQAALSKQQTRQKYRTNHQQTGLPLHSALSEMGDGVGTASPPPTRSSHTLHEAYTNHWTNPVRAEMKRKKEFNLEAWEEETSNTS